MQNDKTDLERIATRIEALQIDVTRSTFGTQQGVDSVQMRKDAWIDLMVELGQLSNWVRGLNETHKELQSQLPQVHVPGGFSAPLKKQASDETD